MLPNCLAIVELLETEQPTDFYVWDILNSEECSVVQVHEDTGDESVQ